jgi:hypothetical protein
MGVLMRLDLIKGRVSNPAPPPPRSLAAILWLPNLAKDVRPYAETTLERSNRESVIPDLPRPGRYPILEFTAIGMRAIGFPFAPTLSLCRLMS